MADSKPLEPDLNSRALERTFERKVWRSKLALVFEQVWRRIWVLLLLGGVFLLASLLGLWSMLPALPHKIILAVFIGAALLSLLSLVFVRWPTRSDAIRRIERVSNIPHRPASSYEDTLTAETDNPETKAIWLAHRQRLAALFQRLKVGKPRPRTDRYDPFALRALLLILIGTTFGFVGFQASDRIKAAFQFSDTAAIKSARLDAWLSPPNYTTMAPVMLSDGATPLTLNAAPSNTNETPKPVTVPSGSTLVVRISGLENTKANVALYSSESFEDETKAEILQPEKSISGGNVQEFRTKVGDDSMVRVSTGSNQLARWYIAVIPDKLPTIQLMQPPSGTPRGAMKLTYQVQDDYGVTSAIAHFSASTKAPTPEARTKGQGKNSPQNSNHPARAPLEMKIPLPGAQSKTNITETYLDFAPTPWAGQRAVMTLKATDVAGQVGKSKSFEIVLPERKFTKPLARAVIEQRRKLFDRNPNARRHEVALALRALTTDPEDFFEDTRVYLNLRAVFHRLKVRGTPDAIKQSIDQLWHTALRIEEGDLSDAERRLREAQEKLAKALREGASDEEIKKLMAELRAAMNDYMDQLAKQAQDQPRDFTQDNNNQSVNQNDLNEMMRNIEELAKNGAREQAEQLLAQMRDMMERMQRPSQQNSKQAQQQRDRMDAMRKLNGMMGDQQKLMDDTFTEQHHGGQKPGEKMSQQQSQGRGQKGQKGQMSSGRQSQHGTMKPGQQSQNQAGRGQRGQRGQGQRGQRGQGRQKMPTASQLAERQRQLAEQLDALQRHLSEQGLGTPEHLENARQAMENAEQALRNNNLPRAMDEQARALSNLQQGSQEMAQEIMENSPQRFGNKGKGRRDPLGRPEKTSGPELGTSVKVPDQIELQRAREIIDELRRRRGEVTRPMIELDYLDRLLKRF